MPLVPSSSGSRGRRRRGRTAEFRVDDMVVQRRVVADLEQRCTAGAGVRRGCRAGVSGFWDAVGELPEERVGAQSDRHDAASCRRAPSSGAGVGRSRPDQLERRGIVGEAAQEQAVDGGSELGEQARARRCRRRSPGCRRTCGTSPGGRATPATTARDVIRGGRLAAPDGPLRLVRHDHGTGRGVADGMVSAESDLLLGSRRPRPSAVLRASLADAEHGVRPLRRRRRSWRRRRASFSPKMPAALGVPHLDVRGSRVRPAVRR